jgi:transcriptional regulator with XRE-family HTH domain
MDLREVFAANLRRLRNAKGVSQDELAYEANVSRSYLSQLEKGTFYASLNVVGPLSEALGVETSEILKIPHNRVSRIQRQLFEKPRLPRIVVVLSNSSPALARDRKKALCPTARDRGRGIFQSIGNHAGLHQSNPRDLNEACLP